MGIGDPSRSTPKPQNPVKFGGELIKSKLHVRVIENFYTALDDVVDTVFYRWELVGILRLENCFLEANGCPSTYFRYLNHRIEVHIDELQMLEAVNCEVFLGPTLELVIAKIKSL